MFDFHLSLCVLLVLRSLEALVKYRSKAYLVRFNPLIGIIEGGGPQDNLDHLGISSVFDCSLKCWKRVEISNSWDIKFFIFRRFSSAKISLTLKLYVTEGLMLLRTR